MSVKCMNSLLLSIFFLLAYAHGEPFTSQEYGISFDYPLDAKAEFSSEGIGFASDEGVSIGVTKADFSEGRNTIDDLAMEIEDTLNQGDQELRTLSREEINIDGKNALQKEYSLVIEANGQKSVRKVRNIYVDRGDCFLILIFSSNEYYFDRADKIYFNPLNKSIRIFPIDDEIEDCIKGFPVYATKPIWSSPLLADIDRDGSLDIVVGTNENKLHAWNKEGGKLKGFPFRADGIIASSPAWGDIDGNGENEIVFASDDGNVYAINEKGVLVKGFPRSTEGSIRSSPALGDINGDEIPEIIIGSYDTGLYSFSKNGTKVCGFPVITGPSSIGGVWSSPAIGDIDGDGSLDVLIGATTVNTGLSELLGAEISRAMLFAVNGSGEQIDGFPVGFGSYVLGYSSPLLADINKDGHMEILVGTSQGLQCLDWKGKSIDGFPIETDGSMQDNFITVGDLENDGELEIVSGCNDGRLYVWKADGSDYPGFPIQTGGCVRHVILGDIDNCGNQEILGGSTDNRVHCWKLDGSEMPGFPKATMDNIDTAPALGDLDGDGSLELVVGSSDKGLYVWRISDNFGELKWPMFRQKPEHNGFVDA